MNREFALGPCQSTATFACSHGASSPSIHNFWRVGTAIHNSDRCDSQLRTLDSQLGSQLLAGKRLEWRSLNRDRHSHGCCLSLIDAPTPSLPPARPTSCASVAAAAPIALSTSSPCRFYAPIRVADFFSIP